MKRITAVAVTACLAAAAAAAGEVKVKNTLAVGATIARGNSETLQGNISLLTEGEAESVGSVRLGGEANYGQSTADGKSDTTLDNSKLFANARKTLSPRWYVYVDTSAARDRVADVNYRILAGPGVGGYVVQGTNAALSIEAGASYEWSRLADVSDRFVVARVAQRFDYRMGPSAKVWQSVEYLPKADDFGRFTLNAELGAEAALNSRFNLRVVLQDKYNSEPGADLKPNDLTLIAGVATKF